MCLIYDLIKNGSEKGILIRHIIQNIYVKNM